MSLARYLAEPANRLRSAVSGILPILDRDNPDALAPMDLPHAGESPLNAQRLRHVLSFGPRQAGQLHGRVVARTAAGQLAHTTYAALPGDVDTGERARAGRAPAKGGRVRVWLFGGDLAPSSGAVSPDAKPCAGCK